MKNLYKALAGFQQEVPVILKDTSGYGYKYADFPAILKEVNPLMAKHGLGFTQIFDGDDLTTIIFHVDSGEELTSTVCIPVDSLVYEEVTKFQKLQDGSIKEIKASVIKGFDGMNKAQAIGSLMSYFKRYALSAILGLVTDKDTDGAAAPQQSVPAKSATTAKTNNTTSAPVKGNVPEF